MRQGGLSPAGRQPQGWQHALGFCIFAMLVVLGAPSGADIATDGTVGPASNLVGPDFRIDAELGTTRGANLFHSFQTFNFGPSESATFTGPDNLANVISRVTGGETSTIDGLLRSEVGQADFFFLNPAGVLFGPNAQVDVPAAFHVGTSDMLRFEDGAVFSAVDPAASTLSAAPPESFGFLSPRPASITIDGSQLEFAPSSRASMAAGDVTIRSGARLATDGGDIQIAAVGDSGDVVPFAVAGATDLAGNGTVAINESSTIDVSGTQGSEMVTLCGGAIEITESVIAADHRGSEASDGRIFVEADSVRVINSDIRAEVFGTGRGNDIIIVAEEFEVDAATATDGRSRLTTRVKPAASGAAGNIRVEATHVTLADGGQISSIVEDGARGQGGTVEVRATDSITIEGSNEAQFSSSIGTTVLSESDAAVGGAIVIEAPTASLRIARGGFLQSGTAGAGRAGDIRIATHNLEITGNAAIDSRTFGSGNAGAIQIDAVGNIAISGSTLFAATNGPGDAGSITISAALLEIQHTELDVRTSNTGKAGEIRLEASDSVLLTNNSGIEAFSGSVSADSQLGDAGSVRIKTNALSMQDSSISVFSRGRANAGTIEVIANEIHVDNTTDETITAFNASNFRGASVAPGSDLVAAEEGRSGTIVLTASDIVFDHGTNISIITNTGDGGSVTIRADDLRLLNGATVLAINAGPGRGGDVQVDVSDTFLIEGGSPLNGSASSGGISASPIVLDLPGSPSETGPAGKITIAAEKIIIGQFGRIISDSFSNAPAGPITLNVGTLEAKDGGEITSSAGAEGAGADIRIIAQESVTVHGVHPDLPTDPSEISADAAFSDADGKGGSILVQSPLLVLKQGGELSSETGGGGGGGAIKLTVDELVIGSGGEINTSTFGSARAGTIQIDANAISINQEGSESLNPLLQETGLFSRALLDATGDAGTIRVTAASLIINESEISITTNQTLSEKRLGSRPEGLIRIDAGKVHLDQGARITAESTGNVPASAIEIQAGELIINDEGRITTESNNGDGGPIRIGGDNLVLRASQINTSVQGETGDGGDITVNADALVLQGGFIQANTAAPKASGGDIFIDTQALVASRGLLEVGGIERLTFEPGSGRNVIQAAAPGGEQGTITLTAPELDISGTLVPLFTAFVDAPRLISDPCAAAAGKEASSLVQRGRGGIPAGPEAPAAVSFGGARLDHLLDTEAEPWVPGLPTGEKSSSNPTPTGCAGSR